VLELNNYILKVLVYWDLEYPDKRIGDNLFEVYDNKALKKTIEECCDFKLNIPNCCGEINRTFF
jgi:hypothetical protein